MHIPHDTSLEIHLCGPSEFVVDSIVFRHKLLGQGVRRLTRGKISTTVSGAAPLPWTSAVKAFVQLAIQVALQRYDNGDTVVDPFHFGLTGEKGSLCRSLDYAISKKPAWIMDLFGSDADGCSHVGRFFWRRNPEGKRFGPSSVTFNTKMVPPEGVSVRLNGKPVEGKAQLQMVLNSLTPAGESHVTHGQHDLGMCGSTHNVPPSSDDGLLKELLSGLMKRELLRTLSSTPIFSRHELNQSVQEIGDNALFRSIAGKHIRSLDSVLEWSSHTSRTGIFPSLHTLRSLYTVDNPLQVSVSVVTIGTIVLFQYLKRHRDIPIEINYRFSTGIEVARAVQGASIEPDLCAGAAPSAIAIMGGTQSYPYKPVMLMPKHSHRLISSRNGSDSIAHGDYRLLTEEPSGALSYFQELTRRNFLNQDTISLSHCDPDETLYLLAQDNPDLRTILWFPAYDLARLYCGAKIIDKEMGPLGDSWILLLAHERLRRNKPVLSALLTELHGAWLDLRENQKLMDEIVASIVADPEYSKVLTRCHGFHRLRETEMSGGLRVAASKFTAATCFTE